MIEAGLIEKALILYVTMVASGVFGSILLLKPSSKVKTFHIVLGILIFIISALFTTKTSFNSDPLSLYLMEILNKK
jgi:hypothetical protein